VIPGVVAYGMAGDGNSTYKFRMLLRGLADHEKGGSSHFFLFYKAGPMCNA